MRAPWDVVGLRHLIRAAAFNFLSSLHLHQRRLTTDELSRASAEP